MTAQYAEEYPDSGDPGPESPGVPYVPHPATAYFSSRLREFCDAIIVRELKNGGVRKLNVPALYALLEEQSPDLAISMRQVRRYYDGTATPRIDVVYEIARLFGVSPQIFLPESAEDPGVGEPGTAAPSDAGE